MSSSRTMFIRTAWIAAISLAALVIAGPLVTAWRPAGLASAAAGRLHDAAAPAADQCGSTLSNLPPDSLGDVQRLWSAGFAADDRDHDHGT